MVDGSCSWKWDFLLPWCERVFGRLRFVKGALEDAPGQSFRGIQVQLPSFAGGDGNSSFVQELRESLGLLAAVAQVDNAAWKNLLVQYANLDVDTQEELFEDEFMPRFQLALVDDGPDEVGELLKGVDAFCGTGQYSGCSAEYKEALAKIAGMSGGKYTGSTEIEIPVTVQLGPWLTSSSEAMLAYLRKLQETVRTVRVQRHEYWEQAPLRITFVLESIMVDLRDVSISADLAELVESLAHDGIRISGLALRHELCSRITSNGSHEEARKVLGLLVFGLFGGSKGTEALAGNEWGDFDFEATAMTGPLASELGHANQLKLSSVHFDCEAMQSWVFERICSAVAVNQTTKHLSLGLELNDGEVEDDGDWALCRWRWQWIIFACFSERARLHSRLENLTLRNAVITTDAVQAMAEVLESSGPEEALLGLKTYSSDAAIDICIKANSPIKLLPMNLDEALDNCRSHKIDRELAGVKLMTENDKSDWVDALVPGFGKCRVQRTSLIYRVLTLPRSGLAGVTSLAIKFGEDPDPEVLQGLLMLVGASLTHLTLEFEGFDTGDLEGIVACCPKLMELAVCTHTIEMRFCLRDSNYQDLALYSASHISFWDVGAIAEALCDSENPFTKCARRLRVRMDQRAVYHPFDDCYAAVLRMLEMNHTLEYLDIVAQRSHMAHYNDFKAHHLEPLPVALIFPMSCKAAFLSVMGGEHEELVGSKRRKCPSLMPVLDQHVLIDIFEYAAPHVSRRIYFREYDFFETGRYYMPI